MGDILVATKNVSFPLSNKQKYQPIPIFTEIVIFLELVGMLILYFIILKN